MKKGEETCDVDVDNWTSAPDTPIEVTIGDDKPLDSNAIPIMPSNLMSIARGASKTKIEKQIRKPKQHQKRSRKSPVPKHS